MEGSWGNGLLFLLERNFCFKYANVLKMLCLEAESAQESHLLAAWILSWLFASLSDKLPALHRSYLHFWLLLHFLSLRCDCVTTCRYHPWVSEGVQCANGVVFLNLVGSPTEACTGRQIALVLTGQLRLPQHCIYLSSDLLIETVLSFWDVCQMSQAVVIFFMSSLPDVNKLGVLFQCLVLHITLDKKCAFLLSEVCGSIHIIFWLYGWQNCFSYWGRFRGRVVG